MYSPGSAPANGSESECGVTTPSHVRPVESWLTTTLIGTSHQPKVTAPFPTCTSGKFSGCLLFAPGILFRPVGLVRIGSSESQRLREKLMLVKAPSEVKGP